MLVLPDKNTVFFDVDGTLVLHEDECTPEQWENDGVRIPCKDKFEYVVPHTQHIKLLKEFKDKGKVIVVWTQAELAWAEAVVTYLDLQNYVDLIACKPTYWVDDMSTGYFMPSSSRIYKTYDGSDNT